jgi:phosphoglycerate dehydrogenase-like enzyme
MTDPVTGSDGAPDAADSDRPVLVHVRWDVVTADLVTDAHHSRIEAMCEVPDRIPRTNLADPALADLFGRAEILLTGWGAPRLDAAALDRMPRLRYVAHAAGTVKDVVTGAVWDRGIRVSSAAAANAVPVAEFTLAAILFANKGVWALQAHYRTTRSWELWSNVVPGLGNYHKTVGLVGASRIGRRVAELLGPHDLEVLVADPYLSDAEAAALGVRLVDLDELVSTADVVSLHAPSLPETHHLFDAARLGRLPDGAWLINTARGALVDHDALEAELVSGRISAVIDVTEPEVLPADSPLYDLPNVVLTPHIAGSQAAETQRMTDLAIDEIERFLAGEPLQHEVRRSDLDRIA